MNVYDLLADIAAEAARPELAWMDDALCVETGHDLHFPEKGENAGWAKRVCMACEVRSQCAEYAVENDIQHGIWGALTPRERRLVKRQRAREREAA